MVYKIFRDFEKEGNVTRIQIDQICRNFMEKGAKSCKSLETKVLNRNFELRL